MNAARLLLAASHFGFETDYPWYLAALAVAGVAILAITYHGIFQRSERRLTWALMVLRGLGLATLFLALAKPTWTRESPLTDPGHVTIVLDNSLSMSLPEASGKARYALARNAVQSLSAALAAAGKGPGLEVELADINGAALKNGEVPEQPTVERTDLVRAILETRDRNRSRLLTGMVLVSDGMDNTGRQDFSELADLPVPIFTVGFQADAEAAGLDLAVKEPRAPARAMVNNAIKVEVPVSKTGGPATGATLTIKLGSESYASKRVSFAPGNSEQIISLDITPTKPGTFVFTAAIEADAGERLLANNSKHFPLRVDKEPIRVLYLEGFLRYEYKFLKNRLEDDPDISLISVVRQANPEGAETKSKDLITPERLKNIDVVILGDMEAGYLSRPEYQALVKWLDDKNHALLVLGGYRSFGPDGFRSTPLAEVLPVVFADKEPYQSEDPFVLQLTDQGRRHPVFEISKDRAQDAETWSKSPHLAGSCLVLRAKPGAEVLAVNPNVMIEGQPVVVVATQRYGAGHTMVLTADTTWRWTRLTRVLGQADTLYARFWSQTMRWLSGRSMDDSRPLLAVDTDNPAYDAGKKVTVRVTRQPRPGTDMSAAEVGVEVVGPGGKPVHVEMKAGSAEPDVFKGSLYPAAGGRYEVAATLTEAGKVLANQTSEFLVHGSDLELADTGTNRANLQAIAAATGGMYVDVADAEKLADKVPRKERHLPRIQRTEFWNSPWLFLGFLGAITGEWLIRRRNHLV
jgi:uncharacterized membrane protein